VSWNNLNQEGGGRNAIHGLVHILGVVGTHYCHDSHTICQDHNESGFHYIEHPYWIPSSYPTPQLRDPTLISCITAYNATNGDLTVSWANGTATTPSATKPQPTVVSLLAVNPVISKTDFVHEAFEADLLGIRGVPERHHA
jgi:hypothetical protein